MIEVLAVGHLGGLVILWDDSILDWMTSLLAISQKIDTIIKVCYSNFSWLFSYMYASNYDRERKILSHNLKIIKDNFTGKWLLSRDFNEILHIYEKREADQ